MIGFFLFFFLFSSQALFCIRFIAVQRTHTHTHERRSEKRNYFCFSLYSFLFVWMRYNDSRPYESVVVCCSQVSNIEWYYINNNKKKEFFSVENKTRLIVWYSFCSRYIYSIMETNEQTTVDIDPENKVIKRAITIVWLKLILKILLEPYEYIRTIPGKHIRPKLIKVINDQFNPFGFCDSSRFY